MVCCIALSLAVCSPSVASAGLRVSKAIIVTQSGASKPELHAAQELSDHLGKIVGKPIAIHPKSEIRNPKLPVLLIGQGPISKKLFPEIKWEMLGEEQTIIKTKGQILLIAGGRPRGTLYAVYRLLSQKCGVRWWAPWATTIPQNPDLSLAKMDWSEKPAFEYRESFWFHAFDGDWAARNFSNGASERLDEARGGKIEYQGFVHTYYPLVPPDKYFATHPEWYSLINGKRTTDNAQLCTTNQELRDFVVEQVKNELRANPRARIISVSQNDCFNPCQCENCRALSAKEGSDAALVLDLANYVGEKIEKEFPKVAVDTLAYQWSRHPTKSMKPRKNVIVRLCSIECNFAYPLDAPQNAAFGDDIRGWSKLTNRLYVWDYCTDFAHYLQPHPDYFTLGPTIQFFANNGVRGVFEEGAYQSNGADMAELKAWLIAQMLWNPKQDPNKLVDEFLKGYYGAGAAPAIRSYLDLMANEAKSWNLTFASTVNAPFLRYEVMKQAHYFFTAASVLTDRWSDYRQRINAAMLASQYVWLARWQEFHRECDAKGDTWPFGNSRLEFGDLWVKRLTEPPSIRPYLPYGLGPITVVNEGGLSPRDFVKGLGPDAGG